MKAEDILGSHLVESIKSYLNQYPELTEIGLTQLGFVKRDSIIEECALVAVKQKDYCGCSMTRKSTADDIAHNIRRLKCTTVSAMHVMG